MIAIQSLASRRGVWFHVLCDVQRRHNIDRDADSLSYKGNLCDYVDRAWWLFLSCTIFRAKIQLFLHICNFFCIFVAKTMIYGYIRVSSLTSTSCS